MSEKRLAIDIGGTFADFVLLDEETGSVTLEKEPSPKERLTDHIFKGIGRLGVDLTDLDMVIHGSTVVINTILQEVGSRIGLITTQGFRDVLSLGRGNRPEVYNLLYKPPAPLIPRYLCLEVPERLDHKGGVITSLDEESTRRAVERLKAREVEGIAVCFLHAYANPEHERAVRRIAGEVYPEAHVSISSDITGEFREFERTSTVALNTYVMPSVSAYLAGLEERLSAGGFRGGLNIIQSTGGLTTSEEARRMPIRTLESGPAGGVIGAVALGEQLDEPNLIATDVGGTSFDVALILDGGPFEKSETYVNKRPVLQPTIDITSVGAGGGSIAWLDDSGGFRVGPLSAEADPGPVCFGKGGTEPTVTDAHLVLGRINPRNFLGRRMELDVAGARAAIQGRIADPLGLSLEEAAHGITHLADTNMIHAIRRVTIERGHDPRDFTLLGYGGGGGLFAASLAREMEIGKTIIPVNPAVFSAWGILNSDFREDVVRTTVMPTAALAVEELLEMFGDLADVAADKLAASGLAAERARFVRALDMRYEGQEHTVKVPLPPADDFKAGGMALLQSLFDQLHERMYAHASPGTPTELVNLRLSAIVESGKPSILQIPRGTGDGDEALKSHRRVYFRDERDAVTCPVYDRERLGAGDAFRGPAIVEEWNTTTIVHPGQRLGVDDYGNLIISEEE
ncbi:MAG: hydantoinase/oxoprolinase family protein [Gammaproteobacteria bacterium]|nr:hydantoinase/oxoprolinase family protein [Gammaproteobacteria bacterium]